jgi:AcrR family transcriptional regulator
VSRVQRRVESSKSATRERPILGRVQDKQHLRRRDVADAALGVIAREGLDKASLRAIAAELRCSTGILTHYFRDKKDLIAFVLDELNRRVLDALEAHPVSNLGDLQQFLLTLLPATGDKRLNWTVWIAFTAASISQMSLKQQQKSRDEVVLRRLVEVLDSALSGFNPSAPLDIEREAELLMCIVDGLGLHAILDPKRFSAIRQRQLLSLHLSRLAAQAER